MERYLRFYIKFQSYIIAIATILRSVLLAAFIYINPKFYLPLEDFYDFRIMGIVGLVFGVIWFAVGVSFFYGIYKEDKRFIYPFIPMFMLELFLLVVRDIVIIWQNKGWYKTTFMNPFMIPIALYIVLHVMMTLVSIGKLIDHEPPVQPGSNFVRIQSDAVPERAKDISAYCETQATH